MSVNDLSHPLARAIRSALAVAVAACSLPVMAQEETPTHLDMLEVSATALKVEAPLVETPRPASVVDKEELRDRNVQSLDETFRYRAGVLSGHYGSDNDTDWFKIRGFDQATYQDGLRIYREGFYQWLPETYGLERVELLKGPASILYGEAPPGGVINAISKRPTDTPQGEIQVQLGNNDHRQIGIDTAGPTNSTGSVRYRLVGLYRDAEGDIDFTENQRYYLAPSLTWDMSDATSLTILSSFQKDDAVPYNSFKLAYGTIQDTPFGKVDPSTSYSEPDYDTNERTQSSIGYSLSHRFNTTWKFQQDVRYSKLEMLLRSSYILYQIDATQGGRGLTYRDGTIDSWTIDNRMVGTWFTDRTENALLIGVDYQDLENEGLEGNNYAFGDPMDLFNPVYGNYTPLDRSDLVRKTITKEQTGLYLQNQLRLDDHWVFLAGVRYDQAETDNHDRDTDTHQRADDDQFSFSGGIMYLADNGLSPYVSWTDSFQPIAGTDSNGNLYDPRIGQQLEFGLKYAPADLDGYVTVSAYNIKEENSLVTSPSGNQVQEGVRETQGFELETVAYLTDQLQLNAAYTYNDTVTDNESDSNPETRATLIPRHMASAWIDYAFNHRIPGLKVGGGVRYVGGSQDGAIEVPSYTVMDLMAQYSFMKAWQAQINVTNLADREYVASCDYWCYYGQGRSLVGTLSYRW